MQLLLGVPVWGRWGRLVPLSEQLLGVRLLLLLLGVQALG
jgi:hypothetical protein